MTFKELENFSSVLAGPYMLHEVHIFITCTRNEQTKSLYLITRAIFP